MAMITDEDIEFIQSVKDLKENQRPATQRFFDIILRLCEAVKQ